MWGTHYIYITEDQFLWVSSEAHSPSSLVVAAASSKLQLSIFGSSLYNISFRKKSMAALSTACNWTTFTASPMLAEPKSTPSTFIYHGEQYQRGVRRSLTACSATKSNGFSLNSIFKQCETCRGQGAIECPGCKGSGKNKKNGNIFERWKCYDCQGFGLKGCPTCGKGGLTPEQRGER